MSAPILLFAALTVQLVSIVVKTFGDAYPELVKAQDKIHSIIAEEEASFSRTLVKGIERFKKLAAGAQVCGAAVLRSQLDRLILLQCPITGFVESVYIVLS